MVGAFHHQTPAVPDMKFGIQTSKWKWNFRGFSIHTIITYVTTFQGGNSWDTWRPSNDFEQINWLHSIFMLLQATEKEPLFHTFTLAPIRSARHLRVCFQNRSDEWSIVKYQHWLTSRTPLCKLTMQNQESRANYWYRRAKNWQLHK